MDAGQEILENDIITESIYETFMNSESILSTTRKTDLDRWVSFLALIFDLNYQYSCNYVYQQDYITKLVKRLNYQNSDTFKKMLNIMNHANEYLKEKSDLNN